MALATGEAVYHKKQAVWHNTALVQWVNQLTVG